MSDHSAVSSPNGSVAPISGTSAVGAPSAAARAHVIDIVRRSRSSFQTGMRLLPPRRRLAMYAVYAFCRLVDDIADGGEARDRKAERLSDWSQEIDAVYSGKPTHPVGEVLCWAAGRYDLPKAEFEAVIAGMMHDIEGETVLADRAALTLYARQVAGAVGILSVRIFGVPHPESELFATELGEALQLANILRDVDEDAAVGRVYVPQSCLRRHGVPAAAPAVVVAHDGFVVACGELATEAASKFAEARAIAGRIRSPRLAPAMVMMAVYADLLRSLNARGWTAPRQPVVRSSTRKAAVAIRGAALGWRWPSFT
ncbi:presqualene diphosphate synthase HpnD [Fodinicurvata sp. EGI_FJ10296]|uniref:presqualene diphosphate synthase HpnD n=1 Tax=Fodinicurvata sp. EGI_FJ10296 TaxID=3231908 RepID=UPI0034517459